jgi:hypothetical protein
MWGFVKLRRDIMDNKFLLLYSFENMEGMMERGYKWYQTEEELVEDIEDMKEYIKDFTVNDAIEIFQARDIVIK